MYTDLKFCHIVFNGSVCILKEGLLTVFLGISLTDGCINTTRHSHCYNVWSNMCLLKEKHKLPACIQKKMESAKGLSLYCCYEPLNSSFSGFLDVEFTDLVTNPIYRIAFLLSPPRKGILKWCFIVHREIQVLFYRHFKVGLLVQACVWIQSYKSVDLVYQHMQDGCIV